MPDPVVKVTRPGVIKQFFGSQGINPDMTYTTPEQDELKALISADKAGYFELAELCAAALGKQLPAPKG